MTSTKSYPPIADYALISDMHSCALVSRDGSIDWACFPRFDGPAVFSRLLDWEQGGYFQLIPEGVRSVARQYVPETNVLQTTFVADGGEAQLTDFMPVHAHAHPERPTETGTRQQIVRRLACTAGSMRFRMHCKPRFDYGTAMPHARALDAHTGYAHGAGHALSLYSSAPVEGDDESFKSDGMLRSGDVVCAAVTYQEQYDHKSDVLSMEELDARLKDTTEYWKAWASNCSYDGMYRDEVLRSALTIKALSYAPSGALIAAATTSLPEEIGGERNWDYRYTWLRDGTFALYALFILGYHEEAHAFKHWLEWATVGRAHDLQLMYGVGGERRLTEVVLPELDGYRGSRPVRTGNTAYGQFQLDIYGELMDSAHLYRKFGGEIDDAYWEYLLRVVEFVIKHWQEPDDGIWETRGGRQHFVYSKAMCWVALDRAIKAVEALGLPGEIDSWRRTRNEIREDVLAHGYNAEIGAFVQSYGSKELDASNLLLPLVGFIAPDDPRMTSTVEATQRDLTSPEGLVYRYRGLDDGLEGGEGTFTMCSFWLVDNLIFQGRIQEASALFDQLRGYSNDVGLFSEEIDAATGESLGNFPQAFTHLGFINAAVQFSKAAEQRLPKDEQDAVS